MRKPLFTIACLLALATLLPACVAKRKYVDSVAYAGKLVADSIRLAGQVVNLTNERESMYNEAIRVRGMYQKKDEEAKSLQFRVKEQEHKMETQQEQVEQLQAQVSNMDVANKNANTKLTQSQKQIAEQQKKLQQLQLLIDQQKRNTEDLRKKIADALVDFNASQLTVSMKNGRVYVSMQEALLFPSGSAEVNPKGKEALSTLASVLNQNNDINVNIEGHTDSIRITKRYEDNWALSLARSSTIARILISDYKVSPTRITASGRSQYAPIDDNSTPDGRAHNRRTEIILEPKLDRLMELIRNGQ
jgi:chemotaxis protein MotB